MSINDFLSLSPAAFIATSDKFKVRDPTTFRVFI